MLTHRVEVGVERADQRVRRSAASSSRVTAHSLNRNAGRSRSSLTRRSAVAASDDAVGGSQRLRVAAGDRQRDVRSRVVLYFYDAEHSSDEGRVQERHVGGADEGGFRAPLEGGEPGRDPLDRTLALARVVDHLGALGQVRQLLAAGAHDHDRPAGRAGHDADRPVQQRRPVPFQRRLGRSHPRGPPARQHHTRTGRHLVIVRRCHRMGRSARKRSPTDRRIRSTIRFASSSVIS